MFLDKITKKKQIIKKYDDTHLIPILHCSICNGEQIAGFKNIDTGKFEEVMCIHSDRELEDFKAMYGITEINKEY